MRPRYYCDFCNKGNGSPSAMRRHEAWCTVNPARVCGMCAKAELEQVHPAQLTEILGTQGFPALAAAANDCPACILATLRAVQTHVQDPEHGSVRFIGGMSEEDVDDGRHAWQYIKAKTEFWAEHNANQSEHY